MGAPSWVTVVAYDTPFLAQLATERLEERGIASRLLSDSGGETLPHVSFATGGHRVQVARDDEEAARTALASLEPQDLDEIDVGEFEGDDGVQPPRVGDEGLEQRTSPLVVLGVVAVIVGTVLALLGLFA